MASAGRLKVAGKNERRTITLIFIIACFFSLVYLLTATMPVFLKILLSLLSLMVTGYIISSTNGFPNLGGILYAGSVKSVTDGSLVIINHAAIRNARVWNLITEWGLVMSFGALSYFIFRKRISKRMLAIGLASILLIQVFILPYLSIAVNFLNLPSAASSATSSVSSISSSGPLSLIPYFLLAVSIAGGFAVYLLATLAYGAGITIYKIVAFVSSNVLHTGAHNALPGPLAAPVIPGITLPLAVGLISLAIIITTHEFSHGIIARINKLKIKSVGLLMFGIIPIGAFVEPDEKSVGKLPVHEQNKIAIAGISINFLTMLVAALFMILTIAYILPSYFSTHLVIISTLPGTPAYNTIPVNSVVLKWNNYTITTLASAYNALKLDKPGSSVSVVTNNGSYTLIANATGKIGVLVMQEQMPKSHGLATGVVNFFYSLFSVLFMLSFFIAVINLLPIPMFDGWRIYKMVMSRRKANALAIFTVILFLTLFIPWAWSL